MDSVDEHATDQRRRKGLLWLILSIAAVAVIVVGILIAIPLLSKPDNVISVGDRPESIAIAPDGTIYVANVGDDSVSVILDGKVTDTIPVGGQPSGIAVAPDGTVYVACIRNESGLSVIVGREATDTIPLDAAPGAVAVGADGTVYTADENGTVSVIADGEVTDTVDLEPGDNGWQSIAVDDADGTVYVAHALSGQVAVIADGRITDTIETGERASDIAIGPDGTVYLTDYRGETVTAIVNGEVADTIRLGSGSLPLRVAIAPDGTAYVAGGRVGAPYEYAVLAISDGSVTGTIDLRPSDRRTAEPGGIAVSPDGTVYVTLEAQDAVVRLDPNDWRSPE